MYVQFMPSFVHSLKYVMGGILGFDYQEMKFFLLSSKHMFSSCFVHNMKGVISTQTSMHAKHFGICPIIASLMLFSLCIVLYLRQLWLELLLVTHQFLVFYVAVFLFCFCLPSNC